MTDAVDGKALVRAYLDDVFSHGNVANMERYLAGDAFMASVADLVRRWRTAFPDFQISIARVIAEDDRVVTVEILSGTHDGVFESSLGPIGPTGRRVEWSRIAIRRLDGDRFVEGVFEEDEVGLLRQMDALSVTDPWAASHRSGSDPARRNPFGVRGAPGEDPE
jgi:predicted ester cyclase